MCVCVCVCVYTWWVDTDEKYTHTTLVQTTKKEVAKEKAQNP
jgi:hypothetical protein